MRGTDPSPLEISSNQEEQYVRKLIGLVTVLALVAAACAVSSSDSSTSATGPLDSEVSSAEALPADSSETTPSDNAPTTTPGHATSPGDAGGDTTTSTSTSGNSDGIDPVPSEDQLAESKPTSVGDLTTSSETTVIEEENSLPGLTPFVDLAIKDLATRLDVAPAEIGVVSVEEVTWRDGSLGCPKPGFSYTQALVNGTQIVLTVNGVSFHYHSGGGDPFYCANPQEPLPPESGGYGDT
jgi:hypothetical protein